MNLFRVFRNYIIYKKIIKRNKQDLWNKFRIDVDWINRLYTTIDFPVSDLDDIRKYGSSYVDNELTKKINQFDNYFIQIGLSELLKIENIIPRNELSYGIIFRYKYLNLKKFFLFKLFSMIILLILGIYFLI